ncbi:hypothetical protein F5887DRAFT_1042609 [Amanita rubescens]|nr:hypothetical protein F5887DRAFT_1042609 [Amanita rubescens]
MGQYFQLINIDRRDTRHVGKLAEAILDYLPLLQLLLRQKSRDDPVIGAWAGQRIITAGDYMLGCPPGMLTEAEQAEFNQLLDSDGYLQETLYEFAEREFKDIPVSLFESKLPLEPETNDYVLRNLSMHVYIRINDFKRILDEKIRKKGLSPDLEFTLASLLLINTSWSEDPSCTIRCSLELVPGPWAGNRFDVTSIMELDSEGDLWKDITEEQVEKAFTIVVEHFCRL